MKANPEKFQFILFGRANDSTLTIPPGLTVITESCQVTTN